MDYSQMAQDIVRGKISNIKSSSFHSSSFIYKKTNERLEDIIKYFENRDSLLSVIGSGDQILNAMLMNPKRIDAFDISVFPEYFLRLKIAAIKSLTREEYISFFFDDILTTKDEYYDDLYFDKISKCLGEEKDFWDYLFEYNDWYDIYNSTLFSSEPVILSRALEQNVYLNEEKYYELRKIIDGIEIHYSVENVLDINNENTYDLIYLSNIFQYMDIRAYIEKIRKLTGNNRTEVMTYVFGNACEMVKYFDNNTEAINFEDNGLLIHR